MSYEAQLPDVANFRDAPMSVGVLDSEIISIGHLESFSGGAMNTLIAVVEFDLPPPIGLHWSMVVLLLPTSLTSLLSLTLTWQL